MAREYYDEMKKSALQHKREDLASEECADVCYIELLSMFFYHHQSSF